MQAERAVLKTKEEKKISRELRKAKEHEVKKELHEAKARHAAEKLYAKQSRGYGQHHVPPVVGNDYGGPMAGSVYYDPMAGSEDSPLGKQPVGTAATMSGTVVPTYPLGGHPPRYKYL